MLQLFRLNLRLFLIRAMGCGRWQRIIRKGVASYLFNFDYGVGYMAQATGCFLILSQQRIEAIADKAASLLLEGKTMMAYTDSGTTVQKSFPMDLQTVLIECRYALQIKDPEQYGSIDRVRVYNGLWNFRGL